jgi:hypothetical protein
MILCDECGKDLTGKYRVRFEALTDRGESAHPPGPAPLDFCADLKCAAKYLISVIKGSDAKAAKP